MIPLLVALLTAAEPRTAIVIGSNRAPPGSRPLRFAHADAQKVSLVLRELGQFDDVALLLEPTPEAIRQTLAASKKSSLVVFYYSGHADDLAMYPSGQAFTYEEARAMLLERNATVRIGIVDACRGGAWTRTKGVTVEPAFEIPQTLGLSSEGSVFIASSSGSESAHESDAIRGSFFTHHFVAALRGAADRNKDGEIAIGEAFDYAQEMTVRDTASRISEPQRPSFEVSLHGQKDIALSQPRLGKSSLFIENGPADVLRLPSGETVLETVDGGVLLALAPGRYLVRQRGRALRTKEVLLAAESSVSIADADLEESSDGALVHKGGEKNNGAIVVSTGGVNEAVAVLSPVQPGLHFAPLLTQWTTSFGGVWQLLPRLGWGVGTGALQYRLGTDTVRELIVSGGLVHWGFGYPTNDDVDRYRQFFATFSLGVDGRWFLHPHHALGASLRFVNTLTLALAEPEPYNRRYRRRGIDTWQGAAAATYTFVSGRWQLHFALSYAQLLLEEARGPRSYDPIIGFGAGDYFGLLPEPTVRFFVAEHTSIDAYLALTIRPRAPDPRLIYGATGQLGVSVRF